MKDGLFAILFSIPAFLLYFVFLIIPIAGALYYSLMQWSVVGAERFVGFNNFVNLLRSAAFWQVTYNTIVLIALHFVVQIPLAFGLSYMLYRTSQGFRTFRAVLFIPTIISATIIGLMFRLILNADMGPVNKLLRMIGLGLLAKNWLTDNTFVLLVVSLVVAWQYIGYQMAIILAGIQGIPEDVIDSSTIDGASSGRLFFSIVLPMIKGTVVVSFIVLVTGCLKSFEHSFIMTAGGPGLSSMYLMVYMYQLAYLKFDMGTGSAVGVVIIVLAVLSIQIMNRLFYGKGTDVLQRR